MFDSQFNQNVFTIILNALHKKPYFQVMFFPLTFIKKKNQDHKGGDLLCEIIK